MNLLELFAIIWLLVLGLGIYLALRVTADRPWDGTVSTRRAERRAPQQQICRRVDAQREPLVAVVPVVSARRRQQPW
jgi:hypothetical protein